jgi:hypothetical protein
MTTLAEAKRDFRMGLIKGARIYEHMGVLLVELQYVPAVSSPVLADARSRQARQFKSYDTALRAVREVGFKVSGVVVL